ncbi:sugar phosphate isomerase/epimerase family protein [Pedobacter cryoconitis]|uniref:D-psicose/D-tagatose/L-ribulose 3-epimerase n=1 Tax=Pedobacter cryoconitis TaxID=188932 RepID=A0A327S7A6_9SPHI|nr:sugar phosphate isomerase/epimerase [Pedobacter cryoconitis]RAJ24575.1 D-psicose/D-tagatose/L-ribulose 3-epimerase [Pedobacter cryoconitis]
MVKFGASLLSWVLPEWKAIEGAYAIQKTAAAGFDLLEILLPPSMNIDTATVRKQLKENQIQAICSFNLPANCHIPFYPDQAYEAIKSALDKAAELESAILAGVLHSGIGVFSGAVKTTQENEILVQVLAVCADYASRLGITMCLEPVNRYESYVCTCAADVLDLIEQVGSPALALHLDTFHMNIEEDNFRDPVLNSGSHLKHLHITESNRGMPGEGNVNWDDLFAALAKINYDGALVLENFSSSIPGMSERVNLWHPSRHNAQELAEGSLAFIRQKALDYEL